MADVHPSCEEGIIETLVLFDIDCPDVLELMSLEYTSDLPVHYALPYLGEHHFLHKLCQSPPRVLDIAGGVTHPRNRGEIQSDTRRFQNTLGSFPDRYYLLHIERTISHQPGTSGFHRHLRGMSFPTFPTGN
jgi:hypothetical protein